MEIVPDDIPNLLGGLGAVGLLAWLMVRVMSQGSSDRKAYNDALKDERDEHARDLAQQDDRHAKQIETLRKEVQELREELNQLRMDYEEERRLKWRAEDQAAHYRRLAGVPEDD